MSEIIFTVTSCMTFFVLGYIVSRLDVLTKATAQQNPESFISNLKREEKNKKKVVIDEKKFVTNVDTDALENIGEQKLGVISKSEDDIKTATNKLAQLKKAKG